MNNDKYINKLSKCTGYNKEECNIINNILEENFFISKNSKDKIINKLEKTLNINKENATLIYNNAKYLLIEEINRELV